MPPSVTYSMTRSARCSPLCGRAAGRFSTWTSAGAGGGGGVAPVGGKLVPPQPASSSSDATTVPRRVSAFAIFFHHKEAVRLTSTPAIGKSWEERKNPAPAGSCSSASPLRDAYARGAGALRGRCFNVESDFLALLQSLERTVDRRAMEEIFFAVLPAQETEASVDHESLDRAVHRHVNACSFANVFPVLREMDVPLTGRASPPAAYHGRIAGAPIWNAT